jgi:hypothetical protein
MKKETAGESGEGGVAKDAVPVQLFLEIIFPVLFDLAAEFSAFLGLLKVSSISVASLKQVYRLHSTVSFAARGSFIRLGFGMG